MCEKFFEKISIFLQRFLFFICIICERRKKINKMTGQKLRCNYTKIKDILTEELIMKKKYLQGNGTYVSSFNVN